VGIKLLASEKHCFLYNSYAKKLLEKFVRDCGKIYGDHFITYNVHCLVHINADVKRFGPLDKISSFPFENYLQQLKRKVRRGNQPLVQLVKRMAEVDGVDEILNCVSQEQNSQPYFHTPHCNGPIVPGTERQYKVAKIVRSRLTLKPPNDVIFLKGNSVLVIENFASVQGENVIIGRKFLEP
jgi:hypothetical protein